MYIKTLKMILGALLIIIGIIGLFLPIAPGIVIIISGLLLMGIKIEDMKRWLKKLKF